MGKSQANFRLRAETAALLEAVADERKINKTEVVEFCVARYAAELGLETDKAAEIMLRQIAATVAASSRKQTAPLPNVLGVVPPNPRASRRVRKSPPEKAQ